MNACLKCGQPVPDNAKFCAECGAPAAASAVPSSPNVEREAERLWNKVTRAADSAEGAQSGSRNPAPPAPNRGPRSAPPIVARNSGRAPAGKATQKRVVSLIFGLVLGCVILLVSALLILYVTSAGGNDSDDLSKLSVGDQLTRMSNKDVAFALHCSLDPEPEWQNTFFDDPDIDIANPIDVTAVSEASNAIDLLTVGFKHGEIAPSHIGISMANSFSQVATTLSRILNCLCMTIGTRARSAKML